MILTRKAAAGFLLLAAIVFLMAYYATPVPKPIFQQTSTIQLNLSEEHFTIPNEQVFHYHYTLPGIIFRTQWEAAVVITSIMEAFALICYIALKKLEPAINKAAESSMRGLKESIKNTPEENE